MDPFTKPADADLVLAEGFEEAFIGVGIRHDGPDITVYSLSVAVDILIARLGMDREDARRFLYDRVRQTDFGEKTPLWVEEMTVDEVWGLVVESPAVH